MLNDKLKGKKQQLDSQHSDRKQKPTTTPGLDKQKTKKGTATKKGKKRQADSDEESKQSSSSEELEEEPYGSDDQSGFHQMNNEKESIDLNADDVVPVKKNKKGKSVRKSDRYN